MQSTVRTIPPTPIAASNGQACLIKIYPTNSGMGKRYELAEQPMLLGRDSECEIQIEDTSVSRRHLRIEWKNDGFHAIDQKSTNGTFVNDTQIDSALLRDGDYLRAGSSIFRFLSSGNVEADYHQVIYQLTIMDALTEVHNKRYLMEFLDRELVRSARHHRPLSVVMLDIDHFKEVNDTRGHLCGDYALRELAARLKTTIRRDELIARYGGEEFVVVLPETTIDGAAQMAERMRKLADSRPFVYDDEEFKVTISLGVASTQGDKTMSAAKVVQAADDRLYDAKRGGRNRVAS